MGFQSAPAIAGGRSKDPAGIWTVCEGFNPRPPLLAGDPGCQVFCPDVVGVSIRARHCWRAIQGASVLDNGHYAFQSAPAIAGGRSATRRRLRLRAWRFNPRPPLLAGDPGHG